MGIVFQSIVAGDEKYSFVNTPTDTIFDVHNDSPYNAGISFGTDTGMMNAHAYISPQSIIYGLPAPSASTGQGNYTVNKVQQFVGTIYIYTQTPLGGTTNFASSPAQSITVIAYAPGQAPQGTAALNRLQNVGNPVSTNVASTNSIVNDNNPASTSIIEATQTGSSGSNASMDNGGNFYVAEWQASVYQKLLQTIAGATIGVILGAANRAVNVLGDLFFTGKMGVSTSADVLDASGLDTFLKARGVSNLVHLQQNGADVATFGSGGMLNPSGKWGVSTAGDVLDASSATATYVKARSAGGIIGQSPNGTEIFTFNGSTNDIQGQLTVNKIVLNIGGIKDINTITGTGTGIYNHGLSGTPANVQLTCSLSGSTTTVSAGNYTATQFTVTMNNAFAFHALAYR